MENNIDLIRKYFSGNILIIVFLILSGLWSTNSNAATITSTTAGGLWDSTATWVGGVLPTSSDDVIIANGSIVTVEALTPITIKSLSIGQGSSGILQWGASDNAMSVSGNVLINAGASLLLYTSSGSTATLNVGGNFTNNGFANLAVGTLIFNGSQQAGGSLSQFLTGTGTFVGQGASGIIRNLRFQTTGSSTISTTQNLIVTLQFIHSAGSLNTNGKLSIDNTAQVYGQAINTQVASVAVTNMGTGYTSAPVISAAGAALWVASTPVSADNILVSGTNVYAVTFVGTTGGSSPVHTNGSAIDGTDSLLWVGNTGTIGNALIKTVVAGTQYFYGANLYTCVVGGTINTASPPVSTNNNIIFTTGTAQFLYVGPAPQVSANYDGGTQTLRSLTITNTGGGITTTFLLSILSSTGINAAASVIYFPKIDGLNSASTQKSAIASIAGGITINSTQTASSYSGVGAISTSNGGLNYTVAPTVGFAGPTAINLVTAGGSGFTSAPTITVSGSTPISGSALTTANFTITVDGGKVVSVYLNLGTSACYSIPPTLAITGGGGSGATLAFPAGSWPAATAVIGTNRQLSNFNVTISGFGYVTAPIVSVGTSGTSTSPAFSLACRIALYNLNYLLLPPAANNITYTEGAEVPASRKMNAFTMNSVFGATFTGNLELFSASPLTLTSGKADFGSNTLTFSNASYAGIASTATSSISGSITLSSIGGLVTKTFPFDRTVVVTTGTGSLNTGSTITSLKISRTAAPTGTVTPNTNFPTGTRSYHLQTNGGAVYGTGPTVLLNYGAEDGLLSNSAGLLIARASATAGPWVVVSTTTGSGNLPVTGSRTTSSFTGSVDDFLAFTTTFAPCNSTPTAGTIPSVVGFCTASNSVTITLTGYSATASGLTFAWFQSTNNINFDTAAVGTGTNTPVFTSPVISSTIYYRCVVTCTGGGSPAVSNSCKAGPVICQYNVTRSTGISYNSIIKPTATGTVYSTWSGGVNAGNDEFTNAVSLSGTTFLYQGVSVNAFYASTNGFLSFNTTAPDAAPTNNLISGTLTSQVLAPFWDDLVLRGALAANHDNCMRYKINGTLGSGNADIIIEWADMERFGFGVPNVNFQVILHESGNTIDFNYGNFQLYDGSVNPVAPFSYSVGLNGINPAGITLSDRMILQRANQNFFSITNQPSLSLTPECLSQFHFVPVAVYTGTDPGAPGIPVNDSTVNATTVAVNNTPCTVLCGNIYTSANATTSPGITPCSAVPPGNPDDDVWFKFVTTTATQYNINVTPSINYDAVVQLLGATFSPILCVNANGIGLSESITTGLTASTTYYIRIYEAGVANSASNGEFALCVSKFLAPPANDSCAGATSLTVGTSCIPTASVLPATLAATASAGITACSAAPPGTPDDDVWYTFTTNANLGLTYNISVTGSSTYNAVLQLFSGACGSLVAVSCVNATGNGGTETITTSSLAINTTYHVRVYHAGSGAASGIYNICVFITPPPCAGGLIPANGTPVIPANGTTLKWSHVTVATGYKVYLSTDSTAVANDSSSALVSPNQTDTFFVTGPKAGGFTYYWKVVTLSGSIGAIGCSVNNFNTSPPTCVVITNPLNNASVCYRTALVLTWTASSGATGYDVYLNTGATATTLVSTNQAGTSDTIPFNSLSAGQYAWRIAPRNSIGTNTSCSNNIFTIIIPPVISISTNPVVPAVCNGQSVTLTASGATTYSWSPATGLNTTTGSTVIATTSSTTSYTVSGENVSGCASTASQKVTIYPVPSAPSTAGYLLCLHDSIHVGQGLTANCGSNNFTNSITITLSNPSTNEGAICTSGNIISSFTIPPLPLNSTLLSARLTINGITLLGGSFGSDIRLNFNGSGIVLNTTCFQGASTTTSPNPVNWITGDSTASDSATLAALIKPAGGTVTIKYNDLVNNIPTGPDVTFPATGTFTYTVALASSPKWYNASVGGTLIGSGSPFNPIPGGLANSDSAGTFPFYARCASSLCESTSTPTNLVIGQALVVNTTQSAPGAICAGVPDSLKTVVSGGSLPYSYSWSPSTGLSNATIANPVATLSSSTTFTVTVTDGCTNTSSSSITVIITSAPNVQVSPTAAGRCVIGSSSINLTASGANTYTWLPSAGLNATTGVQVLATPATTTIYTVTGTSNATGCSAKATATISVGDTVTVTATATPTALCPNGSSQLNTSVVLKSFYCRTTQGGSPAITNVTFNTLSNPGVISVSPFFDTYPFGGLTTTKVLQDSIYSLKVDVASTAIVSVWIDYNRNEVYDSTEWNQVFTSGTTGTIFIHIPANALTGITGMRIRSGLSVTNGPTDACTAFNSGSCQNYIITIGNPSPAIGYSWSPSTFLNNAAISNPFASGVTGATTYTVTATSLSGGCSATASVALTITPFTSVTINSSPPNPTICAGFSQAFTSTVTGGSPPFTYSWAPATGLNSTTGSSVTASPTSTTVYTLTVKDNCNTTRVSSPVTLTVNPAPVTTVSGNPSSLTICVTGSINLTANGATTYSWSPAFGLNNTSGQSVSASPVLTTTYTVTGTTNSCPSTASITVNYSPVVTINATANVNPGCTPLTTQLHANAFNPTGSAANYIFSAGTGALNAMTGSTQVIGSNIDNTPTSAPASIGFNFTFEGLNYSTYSVSPDGWIKLGAGNAVIENINSVTSTLNIPKIYPYWSDVATGTTGDVRTLVSGSSPNRIFIIQWFITIPRNLAGAANSTFQAWLYENSGKIEFRYGAMGIGASSSIGVTGFISSNFNSVSTTLNSASNVIATNGILGKPVSGSMFSFNPLQSTLTYLWTPSTNLNSTTLANPTVSNLSAPTTTYTVTATNSVGCSGSGTLTLNVNPSPASPTITPGGALTFCQGGNVTLTASGATTYSWSPATGLNTTSGSTVIATPSSTTAYTVTGFVANGCSASSSVVVNVQSAATPVITYPGYPNTSALNFCQGDHVLLNAGGPYTQYSWSNGGPPIGTNQTYSATSAGTYKVTVTAANGCTASSSISVTVKASPAIPVISAVGSTTLCDDGSASVILRVTNFTNLDSLTWNNFDATSDTSITVFGNDLTFSFSNPYSFNLMVIDRITLCSSTSNDITVYTDPCGNGIYLNSKILIQGYYTAGGLMKNGGSGYLNVTAVSPDPLDVDTVTLYAMASASPFGEIDHQNGILKTNGDIRVVFGPAVHAGTSYYIKVKHHNSIETWSALPVLFTSPTTYLFITSSSQAFLNNMVVTPDNMGWAIYSGDINQDGATDGNDYLLLDPSIQNGDGGYNNNDLNGDGAVDGRDFLVLDPNIQAGVGVFTPP